MSRKLILPDLAGHGDSEPKDGPLGLADAVAGLAAVLDAEKTGPDLVLAGNSMGGWVALTYALEHPGRVSRLVLVNSTGIAGSPTDYGKVSLLPKNREEALGLITALGLGDAPPPAGFVLDDLVEKIAEGPTPRMVAGIKPTDFLDARLAGLTAPADILWGTGDRLLLPSYRDKLMAAIPRGPAARADRCRPRAATAGSAPLRPGFARDPGQRAAGARRLRVISAAAGKSCPGCFITPARAPASWPRPQKKSIRPGPRMAPPVSCTTTKRVSRSSTSPVPSGRARGFSVSRKATAPWGNIADRRPPSGRRSPGSPGCRPPRRAEHRGKRRTTDSVSKSASISLGMGFEVGADGLHRSRVLRSSLPWSIIALPIDR